MILMWRESARGPLEAAVAMVVVLTLLACSNAEPRPRCAQCGMYADSAPAWAAAATGPEGATLRFDAPKCLFRYAAAQGPERVRALRLTEYYTQAERPAEALLYVRGSDLMSPMGADLVPIEGREAAEGFARDHGGEVLTLSQVTSAVLSALD